MSTYRKQIAEAVGALLMGRTAAADRVHTKLDRPLLPQHTPAVMVYANRAQRSAQDYGGSVVPRVVELTIEGAVQATQGDALDLVDSLVDEIEAILEENDTLGNLVRSCEWQRSLTDITSVGSQPVGVCLLQYEIVMLTPSRQLDPYHDDGPEFTPEIVFTLPTPQGPDLFDAKPKPVVDCGQDGCAPPAWGGEVKKDGTPL